MFAATRKELLPPYVVFKSAYIWRTWTEQGPSGAYYNRTKSGWFDQACFRLATLLDRTKIMPHFYLSSNFIFIFVSRDWFQQVVVPWSRRKVGPTAMIGDNLVTHLDPTIIRQCQELDIRSDKFKIFLL